MQDALVIAKNGGVDVFNALDLMGSSEFLSDLKFGPGDGALQCVVCLLCFLARLAHPPDPLADFMFLIGALLK